MTRRDGPNLLQPRTGGGRPVTGVPWAPEDDVRLLQIGVPRAGRGVSRKFRRYNWPELLAAFPGRSKTAITQRLQELKRRAGLLQRTHWTPEEDQRLRDAWSESGKRGLLEMFPRRSWNGIAQRATRDLGLPTRPQGWVELAEEADRLHVSRELADTIVAWANAWAPLAEALCEWGYGAALAWARSKGTDAPEHTAVGFDGGAVATRKHTTSHRDTNGTRRRTLVEEGAFELALDRWRSWEDSPTAASRYDMDAWLLVRWMKAGRWVRAHAAHAARLPPAWWDDITGGRVRRGGRSIAAHALARGINGEVLRRVLIEGGQHIVRGKGRKVWLTDAQVDAALARTTVRVNAKREAAAARAA